MTEEEKKIDRASLVQALHEHPMFRWSDGVYGCGGCQNRLDDLQAMPYRPDETPHDRNHEIETVLRLGTYDDWATHLFDYAVQAGDPPRTMRTHREPDTTTSASR